MASSSNLTLVASPLEQFEPTMLLPIAFGGFDFSLTIIGAFFVLSIAAAILMHPATEESTTTYAMSRNAAVYDIFHETALGMVVDNAGSKEGPRYFSFIFALFVGIIVCNMVGMVPYSFSSTAHIMVTLTLGLGMFIGVTVLGVNIHGKHFLGLFNPPGAPLGMAPFLVMIEIVSYVFRVVSISVRLFANIMAGHMLLKILSGFAFAMCVAPVGLSSALISIGHLAPLGVVFILIGLEFAVAAIQAFVF
jgi:ATP synthase subunit 6